MNYTSTRGTVAVNETYALLHGLAEDGGLYVPSLFPTNCLTYNDVKDKNYQEVAAVVLAKLFPCFSEAHLNEMIILLIAMLISAPAILHHYTLYWKRFPYWNYSMAAHKLSKIWHYPYFHTF